MSSIETKNLLQFHDFVRGKYRSRYTCNDLQLNAVLRRANPTPGFIPENFIGTDLTQYLCILCDQVGVTPYKCEGCQLPYCLKCAHFLVLMTRARKNQSITDITVNDIKNHTFDCITEFCSPDQHFDSIEQDRRQEFQMMFVNCIYSSCEFNNLYMIGVKHIQECEQKTTLNFKFDTKNISFVYESKEASILQQDLTMVKFLSSISNTEHDENQRNIIAQNVYQQSLVQSYARLFQNLEIAQEALAKAAISINKKYQTDKKKLPEPAIPLYRSPERPKIQRQTNYQAQQKRQKQEKRPETPWNTSRPGPYDKPINYLEIERQRKLQQQREDEIERRKTEALLSQHDEDELMEEMNTNLPKDIENAKKAYKHFTSYHYYNSAQSTTICRPKPKQVYSSLHYNADSDSDDDDEPFEFISTSLENYKPSSRPGPKPKLSSEYENIIKRKIHEHFQRHSKEINKRTNDRKIKSYERMREQTCSKFIDLIKPPKRYSWLIAKNNQKLYDDDLNACAIDIENIQIKVQVPGTQQTKIIQVPCWIAIIDSSGDVVFNEFVRHPKTSIQNYLTSFHGLTWEQFKYAPIFYFVRKRVISILLKYKRIIVAGQIADFANLFFNAQDHLRLLPRIICVNSYYNCYRTHSMLGLRFIVFALFGKLFQISKHSPLMDAAFTMYLYLLDYERIEKVHEKLIQQTPVTLYGSYKGYIYPKNKYMSGLINDIMDHIHDWPASLKASANQFTSKANIQKMKLSRSFDPDKFVDPIDDNERTRPYKFVEAKFRSYKSPSNP